MGLKLLMPMICLIVSSLDIHSQVVINEIQAAPVGDEPEWIELYNYSDQPAHVVSSKLCDAASIKLMPDFIIPGGGYAVLTKDSLSLCLCRRLPHSSVVVEANIPSLNNDGDVLVLKDSSLNIIDSACYAMSWGKKGISLERRDWLLPALGPGNLMASVSADSATAGYANSISPRDFDLACYCCQNNPVSFNIINPGRNPLDRCGLSFWVDTNADGIFAAGELVENRALPLLNPGDTSTVTFDVDDPGLCPGAYGRLSCLALVESDKDKNRANDTARSDFYKPWPAKTITINEFMFDVPSGGAEFIELYNHADKEIRPGGWLAMDQSALGGSGAPIQINDNGFFIPPKSYGVVAWDSAFFEAYPELSGIRSVIIVKSSLNLNSDADMIVIREPCGATQDSLRYSSSWHSPEAEATKGRSLEKYDTGLASHLASSWTTSGDSRGATPGRRNSVDAGRKFTGRLSAEPNPFSPSGGLSDNVCVISYELPFRQAKLRAEIYDTGGRLLKVILNNEFSSTTGSFAWDGRTDSGSMLSTGAYVLFLEAADTGTNEISEQKMVIAIGN